MKERVKGRKQPKSDQLMDKKNQQLFSKRENFKMLSCCERMMKVMNKLMSARGLYRHARYG